MQWFSEKSMPYKSIKLFYGQNKIEQGQNEKGKSKQSNKNGRYND